MALTCSFPFYFIQPPSGSTAYKISTSSVYSQPKRVHTQSYPGRFGSVKIPFQIVILHWPHLIYEASLQDLLEPTKEVVIAFMYRTKNGNNVFRSRRLPHGKFEWTYSRRVRMDGILEGAVPPKSCTSVTVTIDKIVVVLGEGCTAGTVTGSMMTTTSKSPVTSQDAKVDLKSLIVSVIPIYGFSDTINLFCVLVFI